MVGAGPGDPSLVTRAGARALSQADVLVVDRHGTDAVAALAPPDSERVYVGRLDGGAAWTVEAVVDLLVERAERGLRVVRLKSGDPFVCCRGPEEHAGLLARGVEVDVVAGVTSATAAGLLAARPGGPSITIASGNVDGVAVAVDWAGLADPAVALVVLTGRSRQGVIAAGLMAGGLAPDTAAALVHGATHSSAQVRRVDLADLATTRLPPPAALVIGGADARP